MRKFYLLLLVAIAVSGISINVNAQNYWTSRSDAGGIVTDKAVARLSFPKEFKLFSLNTEPLRQTLFSIVGPNASRRSTVITLPDASGKLEQFEVYEASNFMPALQAQFPEIRAYSGRSITDPGSTLKISISPQGIQTMVFRAGGPNEYIEPYSQDHTIYAVFRSQRNKGASPWVCSTPDEQLAGSLNTAVTHRPESNTGELKTMRLAQSCNGEYANFFGATSSAQVALVLAAFNATLTRCNGCYEKDLAIHLNLVPETVNVIYYNPATDPYTTLSNWNTELQIALNTTLTGPGTPLATNNAAYDIGHMFGASGGGGNAGCIGCVCVDGVASGTGSTKGRGITSPADGIPQGDNFDIDYVAHEVGHQMGGNHTFSYSNEGTGVNKEVGAGITIMGYAGITSFDPAPHSIDIYHEATIAQIQANMATKSCPVTTSLAGVNATPVVNPVSNYTIPKLTPFALTGSATDADGDPITYCWEQNDNGAGQTGSNSVAYAAKPSGPNWLTFPATTSPTRLCPRLSTILAGLLITPTLPGGDAICNIEALSSVARTLNFRLTVRDNHPYSSTPPLAVGQTAFTDMTVTVDAATGPFQVTAPNTAVSWQAGTSQTVTWLVNGTNGAPINCSNVNILISTDGGTTFSMLLANTPNDGTENITVPNTPTSTARIKVEAVGNIFFDIDDANFNITPPPNGFVFNTPTPATSSCPAGATMQTNVSVTYNGSFSNSISLSYSGNPPGTVVNFGSATLTPGAPSTTVTLTNTNTLSFGTYNITVVGTATGAPQQSVVIPFVINPGAGPTLSLQPASQSVCQGSPVSFTVAAAGTVTFQWQKSTDGGSTWNNVGGATAATYTIASAQPTDAGQFRCVVSGQCGATNSNAATLTVNTPPAITTQPVDATLCAGSNNTFTVAATGSGLSYQWQSAATCAGPWTNVGTNSNSLTVTASTTTSYRCVVSGLCTPPATSSCATLTVVTAVTVTTQPTNQTVCDGSNTSFTAQGSGPGVIYQWQISTDGGTTWNDVANGGVYSGAATGTLNITGAVFSMNNYRYRCSMTNASCTTPGISNAAVLTVNTLPAISANPANATICVGSGNTFSVTASGTGITYQWQLSTDGGATYTNIGGANASSYAVSSVTIGMNNNRYRCVVTGTCPPPATSSAAVLTVIAPVTISTQPADAELCSGSNTSFTVAGSSVPAIIYQWQISTDGGTTWNNVSNGGVYSGATTATLSLTNVTTALSTARYRAQLSNSTCTTPTNSNGAVLTVRQLPTVGLTATLNSLLPGKSSILTATPSASTGGTLAVSWFFNNNTIANVGNTRTVNIEQVGSYQVKIAETWPSTLVCANQSPVITIDALVSDKLFIFPSPNDGRFTVSYYNNGGNSTQRRITIFDSKGGKVYDKQFSVTGAYTLLPIDLSNGSRGIYYVLVGDAAGNRLVDGKVHVR